MSSFALFPNGWEILEIKDACISIIDGDRGKNYPAKAEFHEEGYCLFLNTGNIKEDTFEFSNCDFITERKDALLKKGKLQRHDIVLTTRGTIGSTAYYNGSVPYDQVRINSGMVIFRVSEGVLAPYLYHLLKSPLLKTQYELYSSGAAQPQLPIKDMRRIKLPMPPVPTQRKIAAILTAYDDLIETNKRRIALLEKIAEELYREWFVRMRFPGHQNTKFVKGVPEGWQVKPISSFSKEIRAGVKKKDLADDEIYIGLEHIPRKSIAFKEWATADSVDSNKLRFKERDILFCKIRPYLHKVALAHFSGACSSDTIVLRPRDQSYEGFLLFTVFSDTFIELATIAAKGTKMPRADWEFLEKLELKIPPTELLKAYQSKFEGIFSLIATLLQANQQATESRDLLLPRLISGKLSVDDLDIQFPPSMGEKI